MSAVEATWPDFSDLMASDEARYRNSRRRGSGEPCLLCDLPVADPLARQVHLRTDGRLFPVDEDHEEDPDTQGWFPVGPECAKRVPTGFVTYPGRPTPDADPREHRAAEIADRVTSERSIGNYSGITESTRRIARAAALAAAREALGL